MQFIEQMEHVAVHEEEIDGSRYKMVVKYSHLPEPRFYICVVGIGQDVDRKLEFTSVVHPKLLYALIDGLKEVARGVEDADSK